MFATPVTAASEVGSCISTPSPARPLGRASAVRVDSRCTPQGIRAAHPPNEIPHFRPDHGGAASASALPRPIALESLAVPGDHGLRSHHLQRVLPAPPQPGQQNPEDPVHFRQSWPWLTRLPYGELLPQREVLQRQLAVRANRAPQCPKDNSQPSDHDRPDSRSVHTTQDLCDRRVFRRDSRREPEQRANRRVLLQPAAQA
jgi:hypothetical protein